MIVPETDNAPADLILDTAQLYRRFARPEQDHLAFDVEELGRAAESFADARLRMRKLVEPRSPPEENQPQGQQKELEASHGLSATADVSTPRARKPQAEYFKPRIG